MERGVFSTDAAHVLALFWLCATTLTVSAQAAPAGRAIRRGAPAADRARAGRAAVDSERRRRSRRTSGETPTCCAICSLKRGFTAEILETDGNPLVFAELRVPGAQRTLLFYAHYDGQPVDPKGWSQSSPFTPVLRARRMEDGGKEIANFLVAAAISARGAALRAIGVRRQGADRRAAHGRSTRWRR